MQTSNKKQASLGGFKALYPYVSLLRGQEFDIVLTSILMLSSTAVTLTIPVYAGRFVDTLGRSTEAIAMHSLPLDHLFFLILLLILQLLGTFFSAVVSARLGLRTVTRLRQRIFSHILELPALYFSGQKAGDLSSRVTSDVGGIQYMLTNGAFGFVRALLTLLGAIILMLNLNPRLTVAVLVLIPLTILLARIFGSRLQKLSRRMYDELGKVSSHVQETVGGIRSLKVYNAQPHESERFQSMTNSYMAAGMSRAWLSAAFSSGMQMSTWITLLAIVIYGFALTTRGQTSSGELVAFLLLAVRVAMPLGSLSNLFTSAQGAIAAAGRLDEILTMNTERQPGAPTPPPISRPPSVSLENVSFSYPSTDSRVLDDLSFEIRRGQMVGIVGPSGAGKTTLASMLLGLFPATTGQLYLDDIPYPGYDLSDLRSRMAWVAQDPILHDLSLAENIRFGLDSATEAEVHEAARKAEVLEFADKMPDGLDTLCGERGGRLSGGQRQRVALARAFLRNPGFLILDEPTSALDAASEESIRRAMRNVMAGRTTVIIAHRFSLVRDLDLILVMAEGKIVQKGTHNVLMANGGLYRTLFELQQGDRNPNPDRA